MYRAIVLLAICGALVAQTGPNADPVPSERGLHWFELGETKREVAAVLGAPAMMSPFGSSFESWEFRIGPVEEGEFSHHAVFSVPEGRLVSIARDYPEPVLIDPFFPEAQTTVHTRSDYSVRLRKLEHGQYLLAPGVSRPGQKATQLVLLTEGALRAFYPWIH